MYSRLSESSIIQTPKINIFMIFNDIHVSLELYELCISLIQTKIFFLCKGVRISEDKQYVSVDVAKRVNTFYLYASSSEHVWIL